MVRIYLDVQQDTIEQLESLSEYYDGDIEDIINEIIEMISFRSGHLINISKEYRIPIRLGNVLFHLLDAGFQSTKSLFNDILDRLEAKGLFTASDMEFDLDEMRIWVYFEAFRDCELYVDSFDLTLTGLQRITATYLVDVEKVDDATVDRIIDIAQDIGWSEGLELPESFYDIMDSSIDVVDEDEFLRLNIDITEENINYLPTIPDISEVFKQIMEKAGVDLPLEE